jgi:5-methylcytosine-specific restriction endonuclease McrA
LDKARGGGSFRRFRDECRDAAVRARDDRKHAQYLHETRAVNIWTDEFDGAFRADVRLAPDEGAWVKSALENKTDEIFETARKSGRVEPRAAYMADALVALLRGEAPVNPPEVRVEGDLAAFERGYVEPGERMELVGIGPIPVTMARGLLNDARITILSREGTEITRITSPKRTIPAGLRRWLERAYPRCGHLGCGSQERLQIDHVIPIEDGGPTEKGNLWRLCPYHHKLKTFYRWQVIGEPGERQLVPPDTDPPVRGPP